MKYIFLNTIIIISLLSLSLSAKISKKNAVYQGEAIIDEETMLNAGSWWLGMNQCEGTFSKKWRQELAKLSWEDFKNFGRGGAKFDQGYVVTDCGNKQYSDVKEWYIEIIDYIRSQLRQKGLSTSSNSTSTSNNSTSSSSTSNSNQDQTDYEEKLKKLKSLFDQGLITQDEYDQKRKEILDTM